MDDIAKWRGHIDEIDEQLVELLNKRASCAIEIGKIKQEENMEIYNPEREENIMRHVIHLNRGPLDDKALRRIFRQIIEESKRCETV